MSLDAFSNAKRSTYDKRVVLAKKRALAAAKVNKYRKVQKRLGDSVAVSDAFDPARIAERLDAMEREGKDATAAEDASDPRATSETRDEETPSLGGGDEEMTPATGDRRRSSNKGWNKAVKDGLKNLAKREEREKELAALRVRRAAERQAREASRARRDATRDSFRKKNARGQPVMRHRVDAILERLAKEER